jgi:hypothetical protein
MRYKGKACETVGEKRRSGKALSGFPTPHGIHMFYSAFADEVNMQPTLPDELAETLLNLKK